MSRNWRLSIALTAAVSHWLLLVTVQTGSLCGWLMPAGSESEDLIPALSAIPFIQTQNLAVAIGLGGIAWLMAGWRPTRWLIPLLVLVSSVVVLADQLFYRISADHLRPSLFEVSRNFNLMVAASSVLHEADLVVALSAVAALAGLAAVIRSLIRPPAAPLPLALWGWSIGILMLSGIPALSSGRYARLNQHVFIAAAQDWTAGSLSSALAQRSSQAPRPLPAPEPAPVDQNPRLAQWAASARPGGAKSNVILVVLESVGALNVLNGREVNAGVAPNLARLASRGVFFDSLYVGAPASARSLTGVHTGGRMPTQGGAAELAVSYQGPMLGRSFRQNGYRTALFSSERLDVEGCDTMLEQAGFDKFQDFERDLASRDPANSIHSWGAREEYTLRLIDEWLGAGAGKGQPFFLEYLNAATHHPYGAPPGYPAPFRSREDRAQYANSLHYSDAAIGNLLQLLQRHGVADNTIVAITGDHGESFGEFHAGNLLHKNFIYEENIRGFLLLAAAAEVRSAEPFVPARVASSGDIMPTLLALAGAPDASLPGRDLLAESFESRPVFFHKTAMPEQWGLRDGRWKFIGDIRTGRAQLFDLTADPSEQNNVAGQHADRAARYAALCEQWFLQTDEEFVSRLAGYKPAGGRRLRPAEYRTPGPKLMAVGTRKNDNFTETTRIPAGEKPVVWTRWVTDGNAHLAKWTWTSPSGRQYPAELLVKDDWDSTWVSLPPGAAAEKGKWTVSLAAPAGAGGAPLVTRFTLD